MSRVRDLPQTTTLADDDLLYAVIEAAGPNGGRKISKSDLKTAVAPTAAETKAAYESNPNTNAFTDAEKTKLGTVGTGAIFQDAAQVPYDNTVSGLSATNVQDAVDQVNTKAQADFIPSIVSGRILHYSGGTARFDGTFFSVLPGDILLDPNITNGEVYVDLDGLVKQSASSTQAPPYTIVFAKFSTDLNNIISLTDERVKNAQNIIRGLVADIRDVRAGAAASAGASGRVSDAMHKHNILTDVATTQTPDQANAEGVSISLARADHTHDIPTAAAVGLNTNSTNTQGSSTSFARADHTHAIASGAPSTQNADQSNAAGSSANFAKADHIHNIPTAIASDVGSANAQGSAITFSKSDHVHKGLHSAKANAGAQRFGDISLQDGLGTAVTDDGSGNFTVDTKFGANEFVITSTTGLNINYSGGRFVNGQNGTINNIPAGSIAVSANITLGYLYVAINNLTGIGTVTFATTAPPLDSVPFAQFVSGPSTITSTTDVRSFVNPVPLANTLRLGYSGTGLTLTYNSGAVRINGTLTAIIAGNIVLSNSVATGAIYVDPTTMVVTANSTGIFPPNCVPMATYTTSGGAVTVLSLARVFINNNVIFGLAGDIANLTPDLSASAGATNKYADAGHIHNVPTAAAVGLNTNSTSTQGAAATFARSDHTHAIASGAPSTQTPDQANAAGSSANFAKADHIHQLVTAAPTTTLSPAVANAQGAATSFARSDHTHAIATALVADITTILPNDAASAGVANTYVRGDHKHAIAVAAAAGQTPDQANAAGASTSFARADHVHNIPTAAAVGLNTNSTSTQGAAATFARSDHTHAIASGAPSTQTPDQANAAGSSANFAKADHIHQIVTAAAVSLTTASTNTQGASTSFARADHTHQVSVSNQEATATADDTNVSLTDILMNSMTQTPAAGTYLVMWSGSIVNSANGTERTWVSLYLNGAQVSATERSIGTSGGAYSPSATQAIITTPGAQAIELRWRVAGGTSTVHSRRLTLVRLSN